MTKNYRNLNLDGSGERRTAIYPMPVAMVPTEVTYGSRQESKEIPDYWASVTDVPCPACETGTIRWYEAGYTPGSRICDGCGRFFQAMGSLSEGIWLARDKRFDRKLK